MTNWMNLVIIGAVIIVFVVFVLPMFGNSSGQGGGGSVGGGLGSLPSGDVGQGGLPTTVYEITNNYLPPTTAGVNAPAANEYANYIGETKYGSTYQASSGLFYIPSIFGNERPSSTIRTASGNVGGLIPISRFSDVEEQRNFYGENLKSSQVAPQSYLNRITGEGNGKSSTHNQETVGSNKGNWFNNSGTPKTIGKPSSGGHVGNVRA